MIEMDVTGRMIEITGVKRKERRVELSDLREVKKNIKLPATAKEISAVRDWRKITSIVMRRAETIEGDTGSVRRAIVVA